MTTEIASVQVTAPAKVNLSLRVLARRADGFHEIETFMTPISLCDELTIECRDRGVVLECDDPSLPRKEDNLVTRAANAFFVATGIKAGVSINLRKKIPHGAGLGGGSSDAASTLRALNELFDAKLPREALAKLGESIGSDVPFFLFESAALCRGRGELISPQRLADVFSLVLFKPDFGVPTAWAYSRCQTALENPSISYQPQNYRQHIFVNDLETPVFEKFVFLGRLKMWLLDQPEVEVALMSGSGSTVFAVLKKPELADDLARRAKEQLDPNLWTCACATV